MNTLQITLPDATIWTVPVQRIADDHARYYAGVDDVSYIESLKNTQELFRDEPNEIIDWAQNNMDWREISIYATQVPNNRTDYESMWVDADCEIIRN